MSAWRSICPVDRLPVERGGAAVVDGEQVAGVRTAGGGRRAAFAPRPFSGAMVLSRGLVGSRGDRTTVASPVYKQVFDLHTGQCLDDPAVRLPVHLVRVRDGLVQVALEAQALSA